MHVDYVINMAGLLSLSAFVSFTTVVHVQKAIKVRIVLSGSVPMAMLGPMRPQLSTQLML
jgi:hypothetical protein